LGNQNLERGLPPLPGDESSSSVLPVQPLKEEIEDERRAQQADQIDNETDLILLAKCGNKAAANRLIELTYPSVQSYLMSRLSRIIGIQRAEDIAKDRAQETFERAWKKLPDYRPQGKPFVVWLRRIADKILFEWLRELKEEKVVDSLETYQEIEDEQVSRPEEQAITAEKQARYERALAALKPKEQLIVTMRFRENLRFREIGKLLDIKESAAKASFHRIGKKLHKKLTREDAQEERRPSERRKKRPRPKSGIPHQAEHDKPT
jgi:RNA polymerase sigma factor (sigma-70 family)